MLLALSLDVQHPVLSSQERVSVMLLALALAA
jgi:hypothetical protein